MKNNKLYIILLLLTTLLCRQSLAQIFAEDTLSFCRQDSVMLDAGLGFSSYLWNTGETTQTIWAKRSGWFRVATATVIDSVLVDLNRTKIRQNDTIVCYNADFTLVMDNTEPYCLTGDYPFDDGDYSDHSGYGNDGFSPISFSSIPNRNGEELMAMYFAPSFITPPSMSCIRIVYNPDQDITNSFTLHCWIKPDTVYGNFAGDNVYYLINKWRPLEKEYSQCSYCLAINNEGKIIFMSCDGTQKQEFVVENTVVQPGRWTMVDVVCSLNKLSVYLDAQRVLFENIFVYPQVLEDVDVFLGASCSEEPYHNYQGGFDDAKIYTCDLGQNEINNLYENNVTYNYNYLWSNGETTKDIVVNPTEPIEYSVVVSNDVNSCSDTVFLEVYPELALSVSQMKMGCPNTSVGILMANASGGVPFKDADTLPYVYSWPAGYPNSDSLLYRLPAGKYEITITDSVGCSVTVEKEVLTYPKLEIEISATPEKIYPQNPEVDFSAEISCDSCYVYEYKWDFGDGYFSDEATTTHNYGIFDKEIYAEFVVTHYQTYEDGCIDSASIILPVAEPQLKIPNVFSPNGDGINDTFDITITDDEERTLMDVFTSNTLVVYNKQGKKVFSQNNYTGSPGEFDGAHLSDGVYFYVLKCSGVRGDDIYKGYLHIFRNSLPANN
ncbi:MAG: gliding motility-associated C-terminal domain-containing protein [Bacteroidales bacterium]|nr:gliding motility-associated C-terminal domain-containing protein [Bacteroidales bacterium]